MKVVLDTNVLLAAFATRGLCEAVFEACLRSHEIILSDHILGELQRHLRGKFKAPPRQADAILSFLRDSATVVAPAKVHAGACRDRSPNLATWGRRWPPRRTAWSRATVTCWR